MRRGVRCVSSHESLAFIRRRGGGAVNAEEMQDLNYGEETVKLLAERGLDMIVVHGYKGMGLEFEKQELERTRRTAAACRKHGLKLATYCQVASIFPETFFKDYPEGRDWIARDFRGEPFFYGSEQTYRVYPCLRTPGFREYYKTVVRYLIENIGTDFLHFDNLLECVEPHSCHCENCRSAFTAFLHRRYGDDDEASRRSRIERFGFDDLDVIEPPLYTGSKHPGTYEEISNPVLQEWTWFRCETTADFMAEMSAYAKELNPNVGIEANVGYFPGRNRMRNVATHVPWLAPSLDIIFNEDPQRLPRITKDGVVATSIRAFKIARGQGIGCFGGGNATDNDGREMAAAERMAFSTDFHWWIYASPSSLARDNRPELRYVQFHRENRDLFHETELIADVTLMRSFPTLINNSHMPNLIACVVEQDLIEARIPWVTVSDEVLDDFKGVRVLLLPEVECVSEWMAERLMEFVRGGGGLVMTGNTARYDEWRRTRPQPIPARLLGEDDWPKRTRRWNVGKGRAVYIPEVVLQTPDHLPPLTDVYYPPIDIRYWKPARNHRRLIDALRWAAGGEFSAQVIAPKGVCCEFVRQGKERRLIIHFVNLRKKPAPNVLAELSRELVGSARYVEFRGPSMKKTKTVKLIAKGHRRTFHVPAFKRYLVAVLLPG